jgi:hypothetical protein
MAKIIDVGGGTFIDSEPVDPPEGTADAHIYPYAYFRSLEHVSYGLSRRDGGPKGEEIDSVEVGHYGMEPIAPFWEFGDAMGDIESKYAFEEVPLVEVTSKDKYNMALEALDIDPEDGAWEKSGLYDFRDEPPTYQGTVESYELEEMERAADDAFEFMFQGEEWEDAYRELAAED